MKILFLTNLLPYPLDNGGKIKTHTTLQALHNAGHEIDLICFKEIKDDMSKVEKNILDVCGSVNQIYLRLTTAENKFYMMKLACLSLFSKYSFGIYKFRCKEMLALLKAYAANEYDCIYYDHLQMYIYAPMINKLWPKAKTILDEHNCEAKIMERNAENSSNFLKKIFMRIEAKKLVNFETYAITHVNKTIVLSEEDKNDISFNGRIKFNYTVIPIGVNEPSAIKTIKESSDGKQKILFLGTMTWAPNNDGIIWFLENVFSKIRAQSDKYELYIVGKNPSERVKELAQQISGVFLTGYVDSVDPYYELCDFMVVPLFVGSGQRVKIIEAFSRGMPVISTSIGAEGLKIKEHTNIVIANDTQAFIKAIGEMESFPLRKNIASNGRTTYENNYSPDAVSEKIVSVINAR